MSRSLFVQTAALGRRALKGTFRQPSVWFPGLLFPLMIAAVNSAAATVIFFLTGGGHALVKVGLFDFAAAGALVVTNHFPDVEPYLEFGREIVGFDSTEDLVRVVRHLLGHPEEAGAMRRHRGSLHVGVVQQVSDVGVHDVVAEDVADLQRDSGDALAPVRQRRGAAEEDASPVRALAVAAGDRIAHQVRDRFPVLGRHEPPHVGQMIGQRRGAVRDLHQGHEHRHDAALGAGFAAEIHGPLVHAAIANNQTNSQRQPLQRREASQRLE